jgi:TRAP-type C4-dicarboxylate transport system permease small subunit
MTFIERLPRIVVTALITLAMINLLIGVILRYVVGGITNYMDWDSVPFTWVEEVGEMALAWLTLMGAAIGIRSRSHFTLHFITPMLTRSVQRGLDIFNHLLIAGIGALAAWYAWGLCKLNWTLTTAGLEISLAFLYASALVGGVLIVIYALSMIVAPPPHDPNAIH